MGFTCHGHVHKSRAQGHVTSVTDFGDHRHSPFIIISQFLLRGKNGEFFSTYLPSIFSPFSALWENIEDFCHFRHFAADFFAVYCYPKIDGENGDDPASGRHPNLKIYTNYAMLGVRL